jgi:hypothetical protein
MLVRVLFLALTLIVLIEAAALGILFVRAERQRQLPETFRCRTRQATPRGARRSGRTTRSRMGWATWAHGVLLVRSGRLGRLDVLPVRFPEGAVTRIAPETAKRLGPAPVVVLLRLDDGRLIELAAPTQARELVAGPFLAACVLTPDREGVTT